jgi:CubicO group peptidase (beta-lactamase class C family)
MTWGIDLRSVYLALWRIVAGMLAAITLAACAAASPATPVAPATAIIPTSVPRPAPPEPDYWPTDGWRTATPESQGVEAAMPAKLQDEIAARGVPLHSLLIIRNGYLVSETYYGSYDAETEHDLWSVTKSVIATLVGIAQGRGDIGDVHTPIVKLLPGKVDPQKGAITLEHLLTMTSGLGWVESDPTFSVLYRSRDWVEFLLDLPMARKAGAAFSYCSGCSHLLSAIVAKGTGENPEAVARRDLFGPLGIRDYQWETDPSGLPIGGWGLRLTPRDMAKLGFLYLHQGQWEGKQILPADWVAAATSKHTNTDGELGYGYQWWTYPRWGAYAALGRDGQTIWVAPEYDLIVVTTAATQGHDPIFDLIDRFIMPAVQDG